eukprot:gene1000-9906_t
MYNPQFVELEQRKYPNLRGINVIKKLKDYGIHCVTSCPGHMAVLLSPESINTIILLDNSVNVEDSKEYEILNFFEKLNTENKKEKPVLEKKNNNIKQQGKQEELNYKDLKKTFFKLLDVTTNTVSQYYNENQPQLQPQQKKDEIKSSLRFISKEPILCFGDENNSYTGMWFKEDSKNLKFFILQNNGNLWSWSWNSQEEYWNCLGFLKLKTSGSIDYSCFISSLNLLIWVEKSSDSDSPKTGSIYFKKISFSEDDQFEQNEENLTFKICDLFEKPKIKREIGFDIIDLKESKNGCWIFTLKKVYFINLENYKNFTTNLHPTAILETSNFKFKQQDELEITEEQEEIDDSKFYYSSYCFHPISKELIFLTSNGNLRVASISPFNKTLVTYYEIFFALNYLFCIFDHQNLYFYEPKTKKLIYKIILPNDMNFKEQSLKFKIWNSNFDMKIGIFNSKKIFEISISSFNQMVKKVVDINYQYGAKSSNIDLYNISKSLETWNKKAQKVFYLLNILVRDERDVSLKLEEKLEIHKILCDNLENPSLVWNSTQNISEQKNLKFKMEEFVNLFEKEIEKKKLKKTIEKFTNLNLSLIGLLKKSLDFHKKQIEILNEGEIKIEKENILKLTDIELLSYEDKELLLFSLLDYFHLNSFIPCLNEKVLSTTSLDLDNLKIDLLLNTNCKFHKGYNSKNQDLNQSCILFEILIQNLFYSSLPKLILILIEKLSKKENLYNLSKRCLNWLNNIYISLFDLNLFLQQKEEIEKDLSLDQFETLAQLNIWSKNITNGIKIYLKINSFQNLKNSLIKFLDQEYFEDEKVEIFHLIFNFLIKKGEKYHDDELNDLWMILWKFLPTMNIFEFISILKKNRSNEMEKKSILIDENDDNYLSFEKLSSVFNKFALKLN